MQRPTTGEISHVVGGNDVLQAMVSLPGTFGELTDSVFEQLPKAERVDFVSDSYQPLSIKDVERCRRGMSAPHIAKGSSAKVPWETGRSFSLIPRTRNTCLSFFLKSGRSINLLQNYMEGKQ